MSATNQTERKPKTMIVTGASQGIGAGVTAALLERGCNVVANSRKITQSSFQETGQLALVDGNIGEMDTAEKIAATAMARFGAIDGLVNNAGIFFSKPFLAYTQDDFRLLSQTNLEGFLYITQLVVKQMLSQNAGGSVTSITATTAAHPIAGDNGSVPMLTKGGLEAITLSLALEYARQEIRFNAVAPGIVDTPMHASGPRDVLNARSPMGQIASVKDVVDAVLYLIDAGNVTGEILHVDGGSHVGKW